MKRTLFVAVTLLVCAIFSSCSKSDELTDKTASNLVSRIRSPVEQARAVSEKAVAGRPVEPVR